MNKINVLYGKRKINGNWNAAAVWNQKKYLRWYFQYGGNSEGNETVWIKVLFKKSNRNV
jgi:hypothetical protein